MPKLVTLLALLQIVTIAAAAPRSEFQTVTDNYQNLLVSVDRETLPELSGLSEAQAKDLLESFHVTGPALRRFKGYLEAPTETWKPDVLVQIARISIREVAHPAHSSETVHVSRIKTLRPNWPNSYEYTIDVTLKLVSPDGVVTYQDAKGNYSFTRGWDEELWNPFFGNHPGRYYKYSPKKRSPIQKEELLERLLERTLLDLTEKEQRRHRSGLAAPDDLAVD